MNIEKSSNLNVRSIMKRNKYFYKEKERINLINRLNEIKKEQRSLGYVELETKQFLGYEAYLVPRDDIQNRLDADIFWEVCSVCSKPKAKSIKKFSWNDPKWKRTWYQEKPSLHRVDKDKYLTLSDKAKRYFVKVDDKFRVYYSCTLNDWLFKIEYRKIYRTKIKIESTILESEEVEIKKRLDLIGWGFSYSQCYKHYRRALNTKRRRHNKSLVKRILTQDVNFDDNFKDAKYYL